MSKPLHRHVGIWTLLLLAVLAAAPMRGWLESNMTGHMLIQIPLLVGVGVSWAVILPERWKAGIAPFNAGGIPCTLIALFASTFWMLPRALDAALASTIMEIAKFVSLPLLVGVPLGLGWRQLSTVGRGFVLTNFISMLAALGWLYIVSPTRVCNNYLVNQQVTAGWYMVEIACALMLFWLGTLFVGRGMEPESTAPAYQPNVHTSWV